VTMRPNRTAHVTRLTAPEVQDLFEIRAALELIAVRAAVRALTPESLADLVALKERMDRAQNDPVEWLKRHDAFHEAISGMAGRKRLQQELVRVHLAIRPYLLMYLKVFNTVEMPGFEHTLLLDALAAGDAAGVEAAMRSHVTNPSEGLVRFLAERDAEAKGHKGIVAAIAPVPLEPAQEMASGG
jgi:DNA-binding GntR family transcriptional regulator